MRQKSAFVTALVMLVTAILGYAIKDYAAFTVLTYLFGAYGFMSFGFDLFRWLITPPDFKKETPKTKPQPKHTAA